MYFFIFLFWFLFANGIITSVIKCIAFLRSAHGVFSKKNQKERRSLSADLRDDLQQGNQEVQQQKLPGARLSERAQEEVRRSRRALRRRGFRIEQEAEGGKGRESDRRQPRHPKHRLFPDQSHAQYAERQGGIGRHGPGPQIRKGHLLVHRGDDVLPNRQAVLEAEKRAGRVALPAGRRAIQRRSDIPHDQLRRVELQEIHRAFQRPHRRGLSQGLQARVLRLHELLLRDRPAEGRQAERALQGEQERADHRPGAAFGRQPNTFGHGDVPRQRIGKEIHQEADRGDEIQGQRRGQDDPSRRQGPELREEHIRRGQGGRRRIRVLQVGPREAAVRKGKEMGASERRRRKQVDGRVHRRRRSEIQIQKLRRCLRLRIRRRKRKQNGFQAKGEARRFVQSRAGQEADPRNKQAAGENQEAKHRQGHQARGIRRLRQIRQVRIRRERRECEGGSERGENQGRQTARRIQPDSHFGDEAGRQGDLRNIPWAVEDRGIVQDHEIISGGQAGLSADEGIHLRPFPDLLFGFDDAEADRVQRFRQRIEFIRIGRIHPVVQHNEIRQQVYFEHQGFARSPDDQESHRDSVDRQSVFRRQENTEST